MTLNVEAEIRDLKHRVSELEGSFGFLTQQVPSMHKDLLAFEERAEKRFQKVDERLDRIDGKIDGLDRKIDAKVDGLRRDLPGIVGDTLREVLKERKG